MSVIFLLISESTRLSTMFRGVGGFGRIPGLGMARRAARFAARTGGGKMVEVKGMNRQSVAVQMDGAAHKGLREILDDVAAAKGKNAVDLNVADIVGETAGNVYKLLEGKGEVAFKDVREGFPDKGPLVMLAVGWLLREDKVVVQVADKGLRVRLK